MRYRWIDPMTGEINSQQLHFSQDSAFRIALWDYVDCWNIHVRLSVHSFGHERRLL